MHICNKSGCVSSEEWIGESNALLMTEILLAGGFGHRVEPLIGLRKDLINVEMLAILVAKDEVATWWREAN